MPKEVFVTRIPPSMDRRIDLAADLHFDERSEIVRRAVNIGLALIRDKNWECGGDRTFEDRNVRLAVRLDPTLRRHLTILADQHWTTRAGVLRAALHYGLWKLGAPLGREHYAPCTDLSAFST
jgi:predicted transcriptional regulator